MSRRKLIFFTTADPLEDVGAVLRAYHFAGVAATSGLDAEVRLAGPAVDVAKPDWLPDTDRGRELLEKVRAGLDAPLKVSF